jgi:hypothetical protein
MVHATFRVSGHIDDVNVDLASKELGHDDVGEENVDGAGMMAGDNLSKVSVVVPNEVGHLEAKKKGRRG